MSPMNIDDNDEEKTLRKMLTSLDVQKKAMEHEADAIISELMSAPAEGVEPMGLDSPLVDEDGYPRGDIDVYRTRTQRNRFRVLKTDHKEIEGKIEGLLIQLASLKDASKKKAESVEHDRRVAPKPLPKYDALTGKWVVMNWDGSVSGVPGGDQMTFADLSQNRKMMTDITDSNNSALDGNVPAITAGNNNNSSLPTTIDETTTASGSQSTRPFAKVDAVADESPAEDAGMKVDDLVTRFGSLHANNHDRLRAVIYLVPEVAGEGGTIEIGVLRRRSGSGSGGNDDNTNDDDIDIGDYDDETQWEKLTLSLRPRPFSGRGLLGCHIVPYD